MAVTRTPIVPNPGGVQVAPGRGEHLHFRLDVGGPVAIFAFASNVKGTLHEAPDFSPSHPASRYEWDHLKNPSDVQQLELLDILFSFLTNADYEYLVELRDSAGTTIRPVLHVTYKGAPTDTQSESFRVIIT